MTNEEWLADYDNKEAILKAAQTKLTQSCKIETLELIPNFRIPDLVIWLNRMYERNCNIQPSLANEGRHIKFDGIPPKA